MVIAQVDAVAEWCGEIASSEETAHFPMLLCSQCWIQDELQLYVEGDTGHRRARVKGQCKPHVEGPGLGDRGYSARLGKDRRLGSKGKEERSIGAFSSPISGAQGRAERSTELEKGGLDFGVKVMQNFEESLIFF